MSLVSSLEGQEEEREKIKGGRERKARRIMGVRERRKESEDGKNLIRHI